MKGRTGEQVREEQTYFPLYLFLRLLFRRLACPYAMKRNLPLSDDGRG